MRQRGRKFQEHKGGQDEGIRMRLKHVFMGILRLVLRPILKKIPDLF
jgi:hypothetical protein